jgi:hypothetical protein
LTHATEQQRPDVLAAREEWFEGQLDLDPGRLIFIDESGLNTKMARLRGRSLRGQRCRAAVPHGHWKSTTFTAGLRVDGIVAPWLLDGAMDGERFWSVNGGWNPGHWGGVKVGQSGPQQTSGVDCGRAGISSEDHALGRMRSAPLSV